MLEIILVVYMCKMIGKTVRPLGRSAGGYQALLVLLWIVGEFGGAVVGSLLLGSGGGLYVCALIGAAAGATVTFLIVKNLTSLHAPRPTGGFPVVQQKYGDAAQL